jgi:hypothetical protein
MTDPFLTRLIIVALLKQNLMSYRYFVDARESLLIERYVKTAEKIQASCGNGNAFFSVGINIARE